MSSTLPEQHSSPDREDHAVEAVVAFPLAGKGPFKEKVEPETTVGSVRVAAMDHFGVKDDQTVTYYLTHAGDRVDPDKTVGEVAERARSVKFTLAKELIQG